MVRGGDLDVWGQVLWVGRVLGRRVGFVVVGGRVVIGFVVRVGVGAHQGGQAPEQALAGVGLGGVDVVGDGDEVGDAPAGALGQVDGVDDGRPDGLVTRALTATGLRCSARAARKVSSKWGSTQTVSGKAPSSAVIRHHRAAAGWSSGRAGAALTLARSGVISTPARDAAASRLARKAMSPGSVAVGRAGGCWRPIR